MSNEQQAPYQVLGRQLKALRHKLSESMAEVSGAVEIDERSLERIEKGQERPSEDILLLLINHFGMQDDEAAGLWELAGYEQPLHYHDDDHDHHHEHNGESNGKPHMVIMAVDPRVIYSDGVQVVANNSGVILNFAQGTGTPQQLVTARVGMSREQAQMVAAALQNALQPRQLPTRGNQQPNKPSDSKNTGAK